MYSNTKRNIVKMERKFEHKHWNVWSLQLNFMIIVSIMHIFDISSHINIIIKQIHHFWIFIKKIETLQLPAMCMIISSQRHPQAF
jgi:hypothetical protein